MCSQVSARLIAFCVAALAGLFSDLYRLSGGHMSETSDRMQHLRLRLQGTDTFSQLPTTTVREDVATARWPSILTVGVDFLFEVACCSRFCLPAGGLVCVDRCRTSYSPFNAPFFSLLVVLHCHGPLTSRKELFTVLY